MCMTPAAPPMGNYFCRTIFLQFKNDMGTGIGPTSNIKGISIPSSFAIPHLPSLPTRLHQLKQQSQATNHPLPSFILLYLSINMKLSSTLILATAIFASNAYAGCFNAGQQWLNVKEALNVVRPVCIALIEQTDFRPNQKRDYCYQSGTKKKNGTNEKSFFAIQRMGNKGTLSVDACVTGLTKWVKTCNARGGIGPEQGDWKFMAYPMEGICKSTGRGD